MTYIGDSIGIKFVKDIWEMVGKVVVEIKPTGLNEAPRETAMRMYEGV